jgi:tetratricopeptide (TPR) repeat protein
MVLAAVRLSRNDTEGALKLLNAVPAKDADQIGVQLFKLKLYEKVGDQEKVEGVLLRLATVYPAEREFRRQLVRYYVQRSNPERAEAEVRRIAKDNPTDVEASLDVIRFLNATKGKAAARAEIDTRIAAGGEVFPYQLMAVDLDLSAGDIANARRALEKLIDGVQGENALQARVKLAEILVSGREFSVADQVISEILRKDERNTGGLKLRGVSRAEQGDYTGAIADFRQALYDQPRATDIMLLLALAYERSGQIELADRQFAEALRTSNADAGVGLNYASFLQRRGNTDRAEQLLSELAARQPANAVLWSRVGQLRLARQDWSGAQEAADTLRKLGTDVGMADQLLAESLSGQKQFDASVGVLQNAYSASPDSPRAMYALVSALMRAQKADRAVAFLAKVLDKDPSNVDALVLMASVALAGNRPAEAKERLQKAIEVKPKDSMAYRALADLHLRQGKPEESINVLLTGLAALPTDSALRLALAGALERKGDITAAITEYETLARAQPGSMIVSNNLASLLSDHATDPASLERAYALALSLRKSEVPQFKDTLGWVHYRRGEYKEALSLLEDAAQQLPNLALVRYHLAMTYKAAGDSTKAAAELNRALQLSGSEDGLKEKIQLAIQQNNKT